VPLNLGTPGLPNSQYATNAGPAIYNVTHNPPVPAANQNVVVTTQVHDPNGVTNLTLYYRLDPATTYTAVPMKDDGTGGDAVPGNGVFSATIPGQAANQIVAFYISATDGLGAATRFPAIRTGDNESARECAVMFGDAPRDALPAPPQDPRLLPPAARPPLPKGTDEAAGEVILGARRQVDAIRTTAGAIGKRSVQDKVVALCQTADQILEELASRPRKVDAARSFLTYYLDAAQRIVDGYAMLAARPTTSPEIARALARAEASLDSVQTAFDGQLANVLGDRVLDLESEIELLEKTVRMDDYFSQTGGLETEV